MPEVVVKLESLTMKDISNYIRHEHKHSRDRADYLARHMKGCPQHSAELLPSGWHEILHPPKLKDSFQRRTGWDPFNLGSGPRKVHTQENGPDALSPNICIEAVHTKSQKGN